MPLLAAAPASLREALRAGARRAFIGVGYKDFAPTELSAAVSLTL
jgi:hypothetical protein